MNKKSGFTLIELLAIIVILAIIAVITVPIILNIIENSKQGAAKVSAYGYIDAVNRLYYSNSLNQNDDGIVDGVYTITELKEMGVSVNGNEPTEGWVEIKNKKVVSFCIRIGEYVIDMESDSEVLVRKDGKIRLSPGQIDVAELLESLEGTLGDDGAKYLSTVREVYYNPVTGKVCNRDKDSDKYVTSNSDTGVSTGCMHWYLYDVKGEYANMLLDHNITPLNDASGQWITKTEYEAGLTEIREDDTVIGYQVTEGSDSKAPSLGITYPGIESFPVWGTNSGESEDRRGPIVALNTLKTLTSSWNTGTPLVFNSLDENEYIVPSNKNGGKFQLNYNGYRARLITYQETLNIGCHVGMDCPTWLLSGLESTDSSRYSGIWGYWTSSPALEMRYRDIWYVGGTYKLYGIVYATRTAGVRPVVTVPIASVASFLVD